MSVRALRPVEGDVSFQVVVCNSVVFPFKGDVKLQVFLVDAHHFQEVYRHTNCNWDNCLIPRINLREALD